MKAAIYARVSVKHQSRKDLSIEAQIAICREYLKQKKNVYEVTIFSDLGYSGRDLERPALVQMKEQIERHQICCVIVKDLSRLGRDYRKVGELAEKFFPLHGVQLLSVSEGYDSTSPAGNVLAIGLYHLLNEWYAKDIGRKVSLVKEEKKQAGNYLGSVAPYGYKIVKRDGIRTLEPDETHQILLAIYAQHKAGKSSEEIVQWLWQKNINPPAVYQSSGEIISKGKQALRWQSGTVRNLIKRFFVLQGGLPRGSVQFHQSE